MLVTGALLITALIVFLARGRLRNPLNVKELPQRLGVNITQDASGFTLDHAVSGHSRYRIHASKVAEFKNNHATLQDVKIELYGENDSQVDRIEGAEFDYDQKANRVFAAGGVAITIMRPGVKPSIADNLKTRRKEASSTEAKPTANSRQTPLSAAEQAAKSGEIRVHTSGLSFDTKSGVASTAEHVDFSLVQGSGSSTGAVYDAKGHLILDKDVVLNTARGGQPVLIRAQHAEFERETLVCDLHAAKADYRGGEAAAGDAKVLFRTDGSAVRLNATNGFDMFTPTGSHIAAPTGSLEFDEHNQPTTGHLEGGVHMDSSRQENDGAGQRHLRGSAPAADLVFGAKGELKRAHLQRGVVMESETLSETAGGPLRATRKWQSPVADLTFRDDGHGRTEVDSLHGIDGVVVTGESQRGHAAATPSRLAADEVTAQFGANSSLSAMTGTGHASIQQTSEAGTQQTSAGDSLEVHFFPSSSHQPKVGNTGSASEGASIESATLDGHVVLTQTPAAKPGGQETPTLRAWAGHAEYEGSRESNGGVSRSAPASGKGFGAGGWMHLTVNPRVEDGGIEVTADQIDVKHDSGDAFAHGHVKATWLSEARSASAGSVADSSPNAVSPGTPSLGGQGPGHAVADEAQLQQTPGGGSTVTFRGHARLWQEANFVTGPVITLDRLRRTLTAHSDSPAEPVRAVLLSAGGLEPGGRTNGLASSNSPDTAVSDTPGKPRGPAVIRVSGGDLKYSDAERRAVMRSGALKNVEAETGTATSLSDEAELLLLPPGNHAGKDAGSAQVDRITARGHVVLSSAGRRGTGEQLVYTGEDGNYVLTGTSSHPPSMTDAARGTVTGEALIFHSRDDSVTVEGGGGRTKTNTTSPR